MDDLFRLMLLFLIEIVEVVFARGHPTNDYCTFESFNPTCSKNEAVVINHAKYGRVRSSIKCAPEGYGSMPSCVIDVLPYVDSLCSGREQCKFEVPDKTMKSFKKPLDCKKGLELFLEASYECVKVQNTKEERCYHASQNVIYASSPGYIASYITSKHQVGSVACPWIIRAHPGQQINLTLWDFSTPFQRSGVNYHPNEVLKPKLSGCQRYGYVKETGMASETICGSRFRKKIVYTSKQNEIKLVLEQQKQKLNKSYFFFQYQAVGCTHLKAPVNGWVKRTGNKVSMGCNSTREKWHMTCDGINWIGQSKNCTVNTVGSENVWFVLHDNNWSSPVGILLVAALGIGLGLLFGIALLSLVIFFIKRKRSQCFYGDNPYEEAKYTCDRESHYFIPNPVHEKRRSSSAMVEHFEMTSPAHSHVHAHGDGQYGTMTVTGTNRPPAYTPPLSRSTFAGSGTQRATVTDRGRSITVDPRSSGSLEQCEHHYSR